MFNLYVVFMYVLMLCSKPTAGGRKDAWEGPVGPVWWGGRGLASANPYGRLFPSSGKTFLYLFSKNLRLSVRGPDFSFFELSSLNNV